MSIKHTFLSLFLALCTSLCVFAQEDSGRSDMSHSIEVQAAQYFASGVEDAVSSLGVAYYLDTNRLNFRTTFQLAYNSIDLTSRAAYYPFEINAKSTHRFGAGALIHLEHYYDTFFATDVLLSLCYDLITAKGFCFFFDGGASYNNSVIYGLEGSLSQFSFAFDITLLQKLTDRFSVYASFASHDEFRYPFFITPNYKLGVSFDIMPKHNLKIETLVRCRDQFTTAPYVDNLYLKLYWKITL